ncbi:GAF domain-containing sensor histidine kinase [Pararobbsia alpina]|uniref:GAF domain-containing sensor histidine kinase n=1 Tax=Pararobbsia alpina TaxID=621374 RepID=UPI001FE8A3A9|nr:GAF domain-containing protein [Pararobbsia alpina]
MTFGSLEVGSFTEHSFEGRLTGHRALAIPECFYWIRKLQARFFAGDYASAIDAAEKAEKCFSTSASLSVMLMERAEYHLYAALARAACCEPIGPDPYAKYRDALSAHERQLRAWAENCPQNFEDRAVLVGAEIARIEGRLPEAMDLYERAIRSARSNGFVQNEALSYELAARCYAARGLEEIAHLYLENARRAYLRWGADGKVRQLDQLHPGLRQDDRAPDPAGMVDAPVEDLDLATVIKVSQAVSGEIVPEKLIETLLRTAVEHAGAERGLLILPRGSEFLIQAEAKTGDRSVSVSLRETPVSADEFPESVVRYAARTREIVMLDDTSVPCQHSTDPYLGAQGIRSVLCLPLMKQGALVALLYLENRLARGAFTPGGMAVLKVLASQAAISLENSSLYRELRRSRQYLAQAQKVSHTGSWAWSPVSNAVLYWSDECYCVLGHDPAKGLPSFEQLVQDVHPDDRTRVLESFGKAVREGSDWEAEYRLGNFNTGVRTVRSMGHPILDRSGQTFEYIGTVIDITERKRAEEAREDHLWFLECMDRINRAMQRTNEVEGMTRGVLEEALAIFDCDRAWLVYPCDPDAPVCRAVMEHTHPDYPGAFALDQELPVDARGAEFLRAMLHAPGALVDPDIPSEIREQFNIVSMIAIAVCPRGDRPYLFGLHQCSHLRSWTTVERRLFEEIARRLEDALTSALAHRNLLVSEDALRTREDALRHAREKLAQASRMATVAELSASIAHEINQPLQAVVANGQACRRWLAATPPDIDKARLSAEAIVRDGYATADVISRIRALFKRTAPTKVDLDINKLILQVCTLMADEIHGNGILLKTQLAQDVPMIRADAVQIQQVIVNLVRNAIEALSATVELPKSLLIRSRRDGDNVVVDVQDEGMGLANPDTLFEPFATTKETGMGIGLAICRSIVEAHAGRLWVVCNEIRGVTFSFSLPTERSDAR